MPLKNVPGIISPDLLHALCSMGHGDEIVLADTHFPTSSVCRAKGAKEIRADGHDIPSLLKAILHLFPLDTYVPHPVAVMQQVPSDQGCEPPVWADYEKTVAEAEGKSIVFEKVERFQFYERAKCAFAVVHSGETAKYGNIILKKGLVL